VFIEAEARNLQRIARWAWIIRWYLRGLFGGNLCGVSPWRRPIGRSLLVNPEYLTAVEAGESGAVGFPAEDIFGFDADLYRRLCEQREQEGRTDADLWRSAIPYVAPDARA
jgi:hypothetical protein